MRRLLTSAAREMTPPLIHRGMRFLARGLSGRRTRATDGKPWGERPAEWYDAKYLSSAEYRKHYSESRYYFLWTVVVDRMMRHRVERVLDLGCGPGQFGALLHDKGFREYCGVDLSSRCVEIARQKCPSFEFIVGNILETDVLESRDYDCLIALEFLEHVTEDLTVLRRAKAGTKFFGTVPSLPYVSHVRHFSSVEEVESRYEALFSPFRVDAFLEKPRGPVFYVLEGTKI
ncbi:MAG: class I SAM-dependent methyltransferase [bacterium]